MVKILLRYLLETQSLNSTYLIKLIADELNTY